MFLSSYGAHIALLHSTSNSYPQIYMCSNITCIVQLFLCLRRKISGIFFYSDISSIKEVGYLQIKSPFKTKFFSSWLFSGRSLTSWSPCGLWMLLVKISDADRHKASSYKRVYRTLIMMMERKRRRTAMMTGQLTLLCS